MLYKFFIRCKDSANRVKYKVKTKFSTFNSEMHPILSKDTKDCQITSIYIKDKLFRIINLKRQFATQCAQCIHCQSPHFIFAWYNFNMNKPFNP